MLEESPFIVLKSHRTKKVTKSRNSTPRAHFMMETRRMKQIKGRDKD